MSRKETIIDRIALKEYEDRCNRELLTDLQQDWTNINNELSDQYGFSIIVSNGYKVCFKGEYLLTVHSLTAAKLLTRIILNDIVVNKRTVHPKEATVLYLNPNPISQIWQIALKKTELL